jgi:protein arginine kinase activator
LLKRIHGSNQHVGKSPASPGAPEATGRKKSGLLNLKAQMQRAVQREDFEEAARLRDQIRLIETGKQE